MRHAILLPILLLAAPLGARAEEVTMDYPKGWDRTELPAPSVNGKELTGGRHRAFLKSPSGHPLVVIELTELPQTEDTSAGLPFIMSVAQNTAIEGFAKVDLKDTCTTPTPTRVADTPALRTDCSIRRDGTELVVQAIIIWATKAGIYTVNYTGQPTAWKEHLPAFEQALATIRLD